MATDLENLKTARSLIIAKLATHADKPTYSVDGQSVDWGSLTDRLDKINAQIAAAEGPWEEESIGI